MLFDFRLGRDEKWLMHRHITALERLAVAAERLAAVVEVPQNPEEQDSVDQLTERLRQANEKLAREVPTAPVSPQ